jgi:hypothetical protein
VSCFFNILDSHSWPSLRFFRLIHGLVEAMCLAFERLSGSDWTRIQIIRSRTNVYFHPAQVDNRVTEISLRPDFQVVVGLDQKRPTRVEVDPVSCQNGSDGFRSRSGKSVWFLHGFTSRNLHFAQTPRINLTIRIKPNGAALRNPKSGYRIPINRTAILATMPCVPFTLLNNLDSFYAPFGIF